MTSAFPATPDQAAIRERILLDIRGQRNDAPLAPDDDEVVRANADAAAVEGLYLHQRWALRQLFPQTAEGEFLELHAAQKANLTLKVATVASGSWLATGTPGSVIDAGRQATRDGITWTATAAAVVDADGNASVLAQADITGTTGNLSPGTQLTWVSSPPGVLSHVTVVLMGGGTNREDLEALRARLLFALQNPPGAGTAADYKRWALEVAGVTAAYVYPKRRGLGSCDVAITSAGGLPSIELTASVQAYIESKCPAEADVIVFSPTLAPVDMAMAVAFTGLTLAQAQTSVQAVIDAYFAGLEPGASLIVQQLSARIIAIPGITDCAISLPAGNVVAATSSIVVEWLRKGAVTVGPLA